ncbi:MAG: Prevent-host-death family protein [Candidatus Roizmanbacteria bacterium GW2011_GWA2_35_19]|jgi:prevent-host-death family protein|uniref:Antitoxin n=2 Tax=Candidatus Roizmaniibacteriota TaxID=1752723 RepID=A0A0G0ED61_9BACT|nr:MAG: Prevent-host-death family protein [Candidatus Roizmanbacteria bacterium GW2011_GWC2_35_12]KKP73140.1 MAG: Prevent-host-death family protein [Candidatus Roizmanbacteria bacterium GW2011_GWA2_35_19]
MNTIAISQFRADLPKLINDVDVYMKRLIITVSGKSKAVVMSMEELESLEETAKIMSIPGAKASIMRGYKQAKMNQGISFKKLVK